MFRSNLQKNTTFLAAMRAQKHEHLGARNAEEGCARLIFKIRQGSMNKGRLRMMAYHFLDQCVKSGHN